VSNTSNKINFYEFIRKYLKYYGFYVKTSSSQALTNANGRGHHMYCYFMQLNISVTPNRNFCNNSLIRQLQVNLNVQRIVNKQPKTREAI